MTGGRSIDNLREGGTEMQVGGTMQGSTPGPSAAATPEKETEDASKADRQGNLVKSDKNYRSCVDEQPFDA